MVVNVTVYVVGVAYPTSWTIVCVPGTTVNSMWHGNLFLRVARFKFTIDIVTELSTVTDCLTYPEMLFAVMKTLVKLEVDGE